MFASCGLYEKGFSRTDNLKPKLGYLQEADMNPEKTITQNANPKLQRADFEAFQLLLYFVYSFGYRFRETGLGTKIT